MRKTRVSAAHADDYIPAADFANGFIGAGLRRQRVRVRGKGSRHGTAGRRRLEGPGLRHEIDRRPLRADGDGVPQLGHRRRQRRTDRRRRLSRRGRALSPLCRARLPVGPPHAHLPQAQEARGRDLGVDRRADQHRIRLGVRPRRRRHRRHRERPRQALRRLPPCRRPASPAGSPCRCCGTRSGAPSSTTSRRKSSACSTRRSPASPALRPTTIRRRCAKRSTPSIATSMRRSTTASIARASPPPRRPTRRRSSRCSRRLDALEARLSRQR